MSNYRLIQLTNNNIPAVAVDTNMPLGTITRRVACNRCEPTFVVSSSSVDTITINEEGYYKVAYNGALVATDAGVVELTLVVNGVNTYVVGETAVAGATVNVTLDYVVRVFKRCDDIATNNPMTIQVESTGVALTSGTSNIIVERVY